MMLREQLVSLTPARGRLTPAPWEWVLALGALIIVVYAVVPSITVKDLIYSAVGVGATVAVVIGVRSGRPGAARGWSLIAAANAAFVIADGVLNVYDIQQRTVPSPSIADAIYLAGYPLLFAGVLRVTRPRGAGGSREGWADAAIVCVGTLGLAWHFLMGPTLHAATGGENGTSTPAGLGTFVTMIYPVMDVGVLSVVVGAVLTQSARRRSDHLLLAAVAVMLAADFVYDLQILHGTYNTNSAVNWFFLLNYVLLAAAALHPSAHTQLAPPSEPDLQRRRWLPFVAGAALISPLILLISGIKRVPVDLPVLAATSLVVLSLISLRLAWLFGRINRQSTLLRDRGESLRFALAAQRALEDDLQHQALHDGLTGLANRGLLHDRLDQALKQANADDALSHPIALCVCDVDDFKAVNDAAGHQAGDELLVVVAKRLGSIVHGPATVARLGGDEFAVLLEGTDQPEAASALAERMVSVLRQPIRVGDEEISLSVSVGVAVAGPGTTAQRLMSEADAAMYEAKSSGKGRVAVFETIMRSRLIEKMTVVNAFSGSLRRSEFVLEYQPTISLRTGRAVGFEALVRWMHPTLGLIGPGRFIGLAEDTRFIVQLGQWILAAACREAATWPTVGGLPLSVSVNLSGWQLQDPELPQIVVDALDAGGLAPDRLVLEITESVLLANPSWVAQMLHNLRKLGVRVAIDDFGTGYSSLSQLRSLPVDILKIDKSFIDPLNDPANEGDAFVATIVRLAQDLRLATIAEGIEHPAQRDALIRLGCESGQGYLMSAALPSAAAHQYLAAQNRPGADPLSVLRPAAPIERAPVLPGDQLATAN